jgi:3-hydroxyisobutyrate dehydrogenase-like beta-hydroxyacid dehydrogenase
MPKSANDEGALAAMCGRDKELENNNAWNLSKLASSVCYVSVTWGKGRGEKHCNKAYVQKVHILQNIISYVASKH